MKMKYYFIFVILFTLFPINVHSYNDKKTHRDITEVSILKSNFRSHIKNILNIESESEEEKRIFSFIKDGAEHEDLPTRAYNHFYNPLNGEGLDDWPWPLFIKPQECGLKYMTTGIPALGWAMGTESRNCWSEINASESDDFNDYSWQRARESYYQALTATKDWDRNDQFAWNRDVGTRDVGTLMII
jgi:hypothetical protein